VFKEVFAICRAQGGYVSYSYHNGLWSYRLYESWRGGPVLRRFLPWVHRVPALAQFGAQALGLGGNRISRAQVARTLFRAIDQRHPRFGGLVRRAWGRSSLLRRSLS
jgi:hypothetical protein